MDPASPLLRDIDESSLIARLAALYPRMTGASVDIGDDAAVLPTAPEGARLVTSVDAMVEGEDFLRRWPCGHATTGREVGFKSVAQNLSDLNAMGVAPVAGLVTLLLPPQTPVAWAEGYACGVAEAAAVLGAEGFGVVGGDLSASGLLGVSVTVFAWANGPVLTRSGARPGDLLVLVGDTPGRADVALRLLQDASRDAATWGAEEREVASALFRPAPPLAAGPAVLGVASAGLDVSDGLVRDAARLAAASGVHVRLDSRAVDEAAGELLLRSRGLVLNREAAVESVLFGGEDHGLLLAVPPHELDGLRSALAALGLEPRRLGVFVRPGHGDGATGEAGAAVWLGEEPVRVAGGFDHFA